MAPRTQQCYHDPSNHTLKPHSGKFSWKHAPQKFQKCQVFDLPKMGLKNIDISLPTDYITHSNWRTCLRSQLCPNTCSLHTPPNPSLTQPTLPLIRDQPFDKSNFVCPMGSSPNLERTCTLLLSRTLWPSIPCSTYTPLALDTSGIPKHVVSATNIEYTKGWSRPMHATIPDPTDKILVSFPSPFLSHSPDLDCVRAQRIMFLGRILV